MIDFIAMFVFASLLYVLNSACIGSFKSWKHELTYVVTIGLLLGGLSGVWS